MSDSPVTIAYARLRRSAPYRPEPSRRAARITAGSLAIALTIAVTALLATALPSAPSAAAAATADEPVLVTDWVSADDTTEISLPDAELGESEVAQTSRTAADDRDEITLP